MADLLATQDKCLVFFGGTMSTPGGYLSVTGIDNSLQGYVAQVPFADQDIVSAIPCLDGTRILNTFGKGFAWGSVVLHIFCSSKSEGGALATDFFNKNRLSNDNKAGVSVVGGSYSFVMFPSSLKIGGFNPQLSVLIAEIGGYAFTQ